MRKLLSVLGAATLVSAPITSIVSCKAKTSGDNFYDPEVFEEGPFGDKELNELPYQIRKMVTNTDFITKLILLGRHENLNYNINEILSMYLSPVSIAEWIPFSYSVKGNGQHGTKKDQNYSVDLGKYVNGFLNNMSPIGSVSTGYNGYGATYASYVMGMYGDKFYQDFFKNKRFNDFTDAEDSNDTSNPAGYNAGKNLILSDEITRRNLAWGIQDTGALTNYFLTKGYQGGNPGGTAASRGPASSAKAPTNYDGYLFYDSHLFNPQPNLNGKIKDDVNGKLNPAGLKLVQDKEHYGVKLLDATRDENKLPNNKQYFGSLQSFITERGENWTLLLLWVSMCHWLKILQNRKWVHLLEQH
ncbi:lipoprotein [Spiroplasma eriocheiris]|uniref:lipoprotein n=1 Tax=Spiroplasma eriocheiris TaxID=315358 RepID=UPI000649F413|nr:lipoprotein [Spiroplasma eriocheiris]AHF57339.1 hypothetical protein SPE_0206 [Spiroplasma eriocheiris CCTCC M 207170]